MDQSAVLMLYKTLVQPLFDYNDYVYGNLSYKDQFSFHMLKNTCMHNVSRVGWKTPVQCNVNCSYWNSVTDGFFIHAVKCTKCLAMLTAKFHPVTNLYNRKTRSASENALYRLKVNLELSKNNFTYRRVMNWALLPLNIKNAETLASFKEVSMAKLIGRYHCRLAHYHVILPFGVIMNRSSVILSVIWLLLLGLMVTGFD